MSAAQRELSSRRSELALELVESRVRIRRYSIDPRLKGDRELQQKADRAWAAWMAVRDAYAALSDPPAPSELLAVERDLLGVVRQIDLLQRELLSEKSYQAGARVVACLAGALIGLVALYCVMHGVRSLDLQGFRPFPPDSPLRYVEVALWSEAGALCWLLLIASRYLARRDFDPWYQAWYVSTALRAPFLSVVLMMMTLELAQWGVEGGRRNVYIADQDQQYYLIAVSSFVLGLVSDQTSAIMRDVADGFLDLWRTAVCRISRRLGRSRAPDHVAAE